MMTLKMGDEVLWSSEAAGSRKTKHGVIVEIVAAGSVPKTRGVASTSLPRDHESYVVRARVLDEHRQPRGSKRLYWPRVTDLIAVSQEVRSILVNISDEMTDL